MDLCAIELVDLLRPSGRLWMLRVLLRRNIVWSKARSRACVPCSVLVLGLDALSIDGVPQIAVSIREMVNGS